jgi:hypothetical protein
VKDYERKRLQTRRIGGSRRMSNKQQVIKKAEWEKWHLDCAWETVKQHVLKAGKPEVYTKSHEQLDNAIDFIDKFIEENTEEK